MSKKNIYWIAAICLLLTFGFIAIFGNNDSHLKRKENTLNTNKMEAMVMAIDDDDVTVQDKNNIIYTFSVDDIHTNVGSMLQIEYTGALDKNRNIQESEVVGYTTKKTALDKNGIPTTWLDNGIFSDFYILANNKLKNMTLDEKIGQLLLVRYPDTDREALSAIQKYNFGGYVFFERDFRDKTEQEVKNRNNNLQSTSKIPLLTAVDEEGGKVVRISSNPNLAPEKFKSSRELYLTGGFELIKQDTINKSNLLKKLGINVNLAPVVDVSTNPSDYMYERSLGEDTAKTSTYAKTVIEASKGTGVSYTLKHFPGYGNNQDTHYGSNVDTRSYDDILRNDLPPFKAGIESKAEAVLVSHNIVDSIDSQNPASLSPSVHNLLRNELAFTGIIITDDLAMGAVSTLDDVAVKAVLAGNDILITTDYEKSFNSIKTAVESGTIDENLINKLAFRVLAWKYYKGLMFDAK